MDTLGKKIPCQIPGYAHYFMSIRISQLKNNFISVDQARYATSVVAQYLDTVTIK